MTLLLKVAESKEKRGNRKRLAAVRAKSRSNVSSIEMEKVRERGSKGVRREKCKHYLSLSFPFVEIG